MIELKQSDLLHYPDKLNKLFDKLNDNNIQPIIVGGYVRDFFLNRSSKDIDIELYGVESLPQLENILQEFGSVNNVGKSFGVCKLSFNDIDIDFTLPRRDNKIASGHAGFLIEIDNTLNFKRASSRRDFTMNTIGFDIKKQKFLDPYSGINAINNKTICAVDLNTFQEDPLRVFRAITFASRLDFTLEPNLFSLCKSMCEKNLLHELPKERIYDELKKILLKSPSPSKAFILLQKFNGLKYLHPLETMHADNFLTTLSNLDKMRKLTTIKNGTNLFLMLSLICYTLKKQEVETFITTVTNQKKLSEEVYIFISTKFKSVYTNSEILHLATKVNIELFLLFSQVTCPNKDTNVFLIIKKQAIQLNVYNTKAPALLQGRDILALGIEPSNQYSKILSLAYQEQLNLQIQSREEALLWLKKHLLV